MFELNGQMALVSSRLPPVSFQRLLTCRMGMLLRLLRPCAFAGPGRFAMIPLWKQRKRAARRRNSEQQSL